MACFRPHSAWRLESGGIYFGAERSDCAAPITLPCGNCIGCRISRSQSWSTRILHEASLHTHNTFITLTYNNNDSSLVSDSNINYQQSLYYKHFQRFLYRLRKRKGPVRYFACGEYGELTQRAHWHAIIFGCAISNSQLQTLWPYGFTNVGDVNAKSAAYVAKYATKKVNGGAADTHYRRVDLHTGEIIRVTPEMAHMSLKPGIGARWIERFWPEVYAVRDGIVRPGGRTTKPPRYYDKRMLELNWAEIEAKQLEREKRALQHAADNTPQRLHDRELVALANLKRKKEKLL